MTIYTCSDMAVNDQESTRSHSTMNVRKRYRYRLVLKESSEKITINLFIHYRYQIRFQARCQVRYQNQFRNQNQFLQVKVQDRMMAQSLCRRQIQHQVPKNLRYYLQIQFSVKLPRDVGAQRDSESRQVLDQGQPAAYRVCRDFQAVNAPFFE